MQPKMRGLREVSGDGEGGSSHKNFARPVCHEGYGRETKARAAVGQSCFLPVAVKSQASFNCEKNCT